MTMFSARTGVLVAAALSFGLVASGGAFAHEEKKEDVPFYLIGKPDKGPGSKMVPVAAPPIPTALDKLPKLNVPAGFKIEVFAHGILDARGIREGDKGTIFVSTLFGGGGKIHAISNGKTMELAEKLFLPNGIEYRDGNLYIATPKEVLRFDNIEANLANPPKPVKVFDDLPGVVPHGWKFLKFGPDGRLYMNIGTPCNICEEQDGYANIISIKADGTDKQVAAKGVRNSMGFDWHPETGDLWFGDNQRDWLSEDMPLDELNRMTRPGQHFGYPYCHSGLMVDPEFGWGRSCDEFSSPAATLGAHAAPLGMRFYTGSQFPADYKNAILIARHGPWNRTKKYADVAAVFLDKNGSVRSIEPFLTGFVIDNNYVGRPADVHVLKDGSVLVSDDFNGAIYRISYGG
jgi:glucose/arabinose dehydrogenase